MSSEAGKRNVPFPIKEYTQRFEKIKKLMENEEVNLLYLTAPKSLFYFSGYDVA